MPTKTLIASAYAAHVASRASEYGVALEGSIRVDMAPVKARADAIVANARNSIEKGLRSMTGCTVVNGHARFEEPHMLRAGDEVLSAPRIFLNVGGRAAVPNMPGAGTVSFSPTARSWRSTACPNTW